MASGHCPDCERLVGISPTGQPIPKKGSQRYWQVDLHANDGKICEGSGKRI